MSNWSVPSKLDKLLVNEIDVRLGFNEFVYYESLFSPHITASLTFTDTGNSSKASSDKDVQERVGTVFSSNDLKNKEVNVIISAESGSINFDDYPFFITDVGRMEDNKRQSLFLRLSTEPGVKNESISVYEKYYGSISNSVSSILNKKLQIPSAKISIDQTKNSQAFVGIGRRPFDLIIDLGPKSIPVTGSPGFLFYENKNGFNFKAIDNLIAAAPITSYVYSDAATWCNASNLRILSYNSQKDDNIMSALRAGLYRTKNIFFDPYTFKYDEIYLTISETKIKTLGSEEVAKIFQDKQSFTRTYSFLLDTGNMEVGISSVTNNNPQYWQAASAMRYNLLYSKVLNIAVPFNPELKAGDTIMCAFPKLTDKPEQGVLDETVSGKYLILHLAHKLTAPSPTDEPASVTHLCLVRDTYGLYTTEGAEE